MIFQDPMTSLNPGAADRATRSWSRSRPTATCPTARPCEHAIFMLEQVGIPRARERVALLPVRVLRRHAPARDDRAGAVVRPEHPDRRRADHRARRDDPGADPRADPGAPRAHRRRGDPRDPRPRRGGGHRRPDRGHVRGADRRGGDPRRDLLRPPAPLHVGPARQHHARRPAAPRAAAGDPGSAAHLGRPAGGLPLPPALPARVRQVHRGAGARGARSRRARATATAAGSRSTTSAGCARSRPGEIGLAPAGEEASA